MIPFNPQAISLLQEGALALADVESNGFRVDVDYFKKLQKKFTLKANKLKREIEESEEGRLWKKRFRAATNLDSNDQLAKILFEDAGYECVVRTKTGKPSTSETSLEKVNAPLVKQVLELRKIQKANGTYVKGILEEQVNGFIHGFFNLHIAVTFRSSSDSPNLQNIPIRNPEIGNAIRAGFKARPGFQLVELDYGGIEVKGAACYHKDKNMLSYIHDPTKDMHRDMSSQCYKLPIEEVSKNIRYCGKNKFVFPQFYGDYYVNCARSLWDSVRQLNLRTNSDRPLMEHMKEKGIGSYKRFEDHVKAVEKHFWTVRFPEYAQWKEDWYAEYLKKGFFDTLTGFRCQGIMGKNDVINYPVQGSSFHCLLWSLIRVNAWLKSSNMKTRIVCQIHDSLILDMDPKEKDVVLPTVKRIMCEDIREYWKWIIVPFEVEADLCPVDGSWKEKKETKI